MMLIFKYGDDVFEENVGEQFVRIGWQKQVEEGLGIEDLTNYGYISGYKNSADDLLKLACENGSLESDIYPIVFLYRQYLELLFKNIIAKMPSTEAYNGQPHSLEEMWKHISKVFKREGLIDKKSLELVKEVVQEFHEVDPKSSNFRYFFKYGNQLTLEGKIVVDIQLLKKAIDKVDEILFVTYGV